MKALSLRRDAAGEACGNCSMSVFFIFICSALLSLLYLDRQDFRSLPEASCLLGCISVLLLLTAAYSASVYGGLCLPVTTALMGALCACGFCILALGLKAGEPEKLYLLPVLLLAAPMQFLMSVSGMRTAALLQRALRQNAFDPAAELRGRNIMMLLSAAVSAALAVSIVFR